MSDNKKTYYQWIKGEFAPNTETYKQEVTLGNETFILFESGNQVNIKLIDDYVVEIPDLNSPFINPNDHIKESSQHVPYDQYINPEIQNQIQNQQNLNPANLVDNNVTNLGNAEIIPHPDDLKAVAEFKERHKNDSKQNINQNTQNTNPNLIQQNINPTTQHFVNQSKEKNPIEELINKTKKKKTKLELVLDVELPSKEFLTILKESFDGKEDEIIEILLSSIQTENFNKKIKLFLKNYISGKEQLVRKKRTTTAKKGNVKTPPKK